METTLEVRTLGRLHISSGTQPVTQLRSRKATALLIFLAYTGKTYPRMVLAEMFCRDRPEDVTRRSLRRHLHILNRNMGQYLSINNNTVSMNPNVDYWLDILEVEDTLRDCTANGVITCFTSERIAKLERALALYQGDFMDGFYVDCAEFENWVVLQREQLRFLVTFALDQLVDHYMLEEDYCTAMQHARRLLAMDELREETYRQLMTLSAISDQRVAAFRFYDRFCTLLHEEFPEAKPAPETERLIKRIRNGSFPSSEMNCM